MDYEYDDNNIYTTDENSTTYWRNQKKPEMTVPLQKRKGDCKFTGTCYQQSPASSVREHFSPVSSGPSDSLGPQIFPNYQNYSVPQNYPTTSNYMVPKNYQIPYMQYQGNFITNLSNVNILFFIVIILMCFIIYHLKKLTTVIMIKNSTNTTSTTSSLG